MTTAAAADPQSTRPHPGPHPSAGPTSQQALAALLAAGPSVDALTQRGEQLAPGAIVPFLTAMMDWTGFQGERHPDGRIAYARLSMQCEPARAAPRWQCHFIMSSAVEGDEYAFMVSYQLRETPECADDVRFFRDYAPCGWALAENRVTLTLFD